MDLSWWQLILCKAQPVHDLAKVSAYSDWTSYYACHAQNDVRKRPELTGVRTVLRSGLRIWDERLEYKVYNPKRHAKTGFCFDLGFVMHLDVAWRLLMCRVPSASSDSTVPSIAPGTGIMRPSDRLVGVPSTLCFLASIGILRALMFANLPRLIPFLTAP
jgi:hypothetical protein